MKFQVPYNFQYGDDIKKMITSNNHNIHSIYFGFANSSRTITNDRKSLDEHINVLSEFKKLGIKLVYVLNSVVDIVELSHTDRIVLDSGLVDIVTVSLDTIFDLVYKEYKDNFEYEISRFYFYLNNDGKLLKHSTVVAFGFERELQNFLPLVLEEKQDIDIAYIANENCYPGCEFKLEHNTNQYKRNQGENIAKFECPYLDKRKFYTIEEMQSILAKYNVGILKLCDRAFDDETLAKHLEKWFSICE